MVFEGWVFLVLALTVCTQVDLTIHTVCSGSGIGAQMAEYGIIIGAQFNRAGSPTASRAHFTTVFSIRKKAL